MPPKPVIEIPANYRRYKHSFGLETPATAAEKDKEAQRIKNIDEYFEKNKLSPDLPFDEQKKILKMMRLFKKGDDYEAIDVLNYDDQLRHIAEWKALNVSTITESRDEINRLYQQQKERDHQILQDAVRGVETPYIPVFSPAEVAGMNKLIAQAELNLNNLVTKERELHLKKQLAVHAEERQKEQAIFEAKEAEQQRAFQAKYQEMHLKRQQEADAKVKAEEAKVKAEHEKVKINQQMAISRLNTAVLGRNNSYYRIERDQLVGRQKLPVNRGSYDFYQDFLKRSV